MRISDWSSDVCSSDLGLIPVQPFGMAPTRPFGVPEAISLAFWGGIWGLVFSWAEPKFPRGYGYWIAALLFGAILPTLVAWFVVAPKIGRASCRERVCQYV